MGPDTLRSAGSQTTTSHWEARVPYPFDRSGTEVGPDGVRPGTPAHRRGPAAPAVRSRDVDFFSQIRAGVAKYVP